MKKGQAKLLFTPELLMQLCVGLSKGDEIRYYKVIENGLPPKTKLIDAYVDDFESNAPVTLILQHSSFKDEMLPPVAMQSVELPKYRELARQVADGNFNHAKVIALAKELCD